MPSGSVELRCRVGSAPEVVGPLTDASVATLDPGTTIVGVRLRPEAAARVLAHPAAELAGRVVPADALWPGRGSRLATALEATPTPEGTIARLLHHVAAARDEAPGDPLVGAAVRALRWSAEEVSAVSRDLHVSERQLRRRMLAQVGLAPKALQRTLRFQRVLALAQQAIALGRPPADEGLARLAADAGYADQAHLTRECARLTGLSPAAFLRNAEATCACGHDHAAAFRPLLQARPLARHAA